MYEAYCRESQALCRFVSQRRLVNLCTRSDAINFRTAVVQHKIRLVKIGKYKYAYNGNRCLYVTLRDLHYTPNNFERLYRFYHFVASIACANINILAPYSRHVIINIIINHERLFSNDFCGLLNIYNSWMFNKIYYIVKIIKISENLIKIHVYYQKK